MDTEVLHFKIGLSRSSESKIVEFSILINDQVVVDSTLSGQKNSTEYFEFDSELNEGLCSLIVEFKNKSISDTILDANGNIIEDLLLNIDSIEVDEIDLGTLLWTASEYNPKYPAHYKIKMQAEGKDLSKPMKNCVNLGWNGQWVLPFSSPFYIWLLENL